MASYFCSPVWEMGSILAHLAPLCASNDDFLLTASFHLNLCRILQWIELQEQQAQLLGNGQGARLSHL